MNPPEIANKPVSSRFKKGKLHWIFLTLGILVGSPFIWYFLILDWNGRPYCHKQIMLSFRIWAEDNSQKSNVDMVEFPNVGGASKASLEAIREQMGVMDWATNYCYVPGLHEDDPGRLVLMYFARPTRWTWHGPPPTKYTEKKWIIVPVDFESQPGRPGECSERVSEEEFKNRLRGTLEFVRTNERPNWQAIVAEHTAFLESLERRKQ